MLHLFIHIIYKELRQGKSTHDICNVSLFFTSIFFVSWVLAICALSHKVSPHGRVPKIDRVILVGVQRKRYDPC